VPSVPSAKVARVLVKDWIGTVGVRRRSRSGGPPGRESFSSGQSFSGGRSFRDWRRSRPFWGGLLLLLAGFELLLIPLSGILVHGQVKLVVYIGIGGVFGLLIGALLIVCGVLLWFSPAHRTFYAIAGVLLAVLSFITSNLGGFFLGMLLGITGGSLAFGWTPAPVVGPVVTGRHPDEEPSGDEGRHSTDEGRHSTGRLMASAAMPAVLVGTLLTGHAGIGQATHPQRPQDCILGLICWSSSPPPLLPSPGSSPSPSPSASQPGLLQGVLPPNPSSPSPNPDPGVSLSPGSTGQKTTTATPGLVASTATSVITAGSATLNGLAYQGTAKVPTADGTQPMMKFTLNSMTLSGNVTADVTQDGQTTVTQNSSLVFTGGVTLYATKLSGTLLGIPITLTPGNVISLLLQLLKTVTPLVPVTMTNVTTDQPFVLAGALQANDLLITS
jgi:Family of unknown function (DUF6114)